MRYLVSASRRTNGNKQGSMTVQDAPTKRGLTESEAAVYLGLSRSTLRQARMSGSRARIPPPPFVRLGRTIRYLKDDLDRWLDQHRAQLVSHGPE
jgi:predicted DNA-binding transcriptional regulator AlpA